MFLQVQRGTAQAGGLVHGLHRRGHDGRQRDGFREPLASRGSTVVSPAASTSRWGNHADQAALGTDDGMCRMWCSASGWRAAARVSSGPRV